MSIIITQAPKLKILGSSLIMNYRSVAGCINNLKEFHRKAKCNLITNEELIITHDMMISSEKLELIIEEVLLPMSLKWGEDFIIAEEQMLIGVEDKVTPLLNQELPGLKNLQWLNSEITRDGNLVWSRESEIIQLETDSYWIELLEQIQYHRGDLLAGRPIKIVEDLGDRLQIHIEGVKHAVLFVSKEYIRHYFDNTIE
jgi:hypothetical protein